MTKIDKDNFHCILFSKFLKLMYIILTFYIKKEKQISLIKNFLSFKCVYLNFLLTG